MAFLTVAAWAKPESQAARPAKWRIIFNNDGGDVSTLGGSNVPRIENPPDAAQELIRRRTRGIEQFKVTTISYCTAWSFGLVLHRSEVARQMQRRHRPDALVEKLAEKGTDSLKVMADYCRAHDLELWWSMRMNDTHDAYYPENIPLSQFKKDHPELLLGKPSEKLPFGAWTQVNYASEEVRAFALAMISEVLDRYAVHGIELDFFRHPVLFPSVAQGGEASDADRAALTGFLRAVRARVDEHNARLPAGERKVVLGIKTPDSPDYCYRIGLDLENYLKLGLLDFCVFGGYFRLAPWSRSAELAHQYGVAAYASIDRTAVQIPKEALKEEPDRHRRYGWITGTQDYHRPPFFRRHDVETYRGRILSAIAQGHDGIELFNLFNLDHPLFAELADLETMASRPAKYFHMARGTQQSPSQFIDGGNTFFEEPIVSPGFPKAIPPAGLPLKLVTRLPANGWKGSAELLVDGTGTGPHAGKMTVLFNGEALTPEPIAVRDEVILKVPAAAVRNGENRITLQPADGGTGVLVRDVMLRIAPESPEPAKAAAR